MITKNTSASPPYPPELDFTLICGGIAVAAAGLIGGVWIPIAALEMIREGLIEPLRQNGPLIRVGYFWFSAVGAVVVGPLAALMMALALLARPLRIPRERFTFLMRKLLLGLTFGGALLLALPVIAGLTTSHYVQTNGYAECKRLFEIGFMRYERVFARTAEVCSAAKR